jgi:CRISPR system Cascade subunit CasA
MPTFDLLAEPWLPVVTREGREEEVGLREVLCRAPELRELRDPIPLVEFGLHRLLVAVVMDLHQLTEMVDLEALLAAGRFDETKMTRYFARWGGCFDLFHPVHPFLQTAGRR